VGQYSPDQGQLSPDFSGSSIDFIRGARARFAHMSNTNHPNELMTGCIRPEKLDRLNVNGVGGQCDSSGEKAGMVILRK